MDSYLSQEYKGKAKYQQTFSGLEFGPPSLSSDNNFYAMQA